MPLPPLAAPRRPSPPPFPPPSQLSPNGPQIRKRGLIQRRQQILSPGGSSRSRFRPDRPLHHLHVPIAPFHKTLIQVHQPFRNLRDTRVLLVDLHENALHLG